MASSNDCNHDSTDHLIYPDILFLNKWYVYHGSTWFDVKIAFLFFLSTPSLPPSYCILAMQKTILALQIIFSLDLAPLLLFAIVLSTLVVSNWILFLNSSMVI